jgi:hypothetical protein
LHATLTESETKISRKSKNKTFHWKTTVEILGSNLK